MKKTEKEIIEQFIMSNIDLESAFKEAILTIEMDSIFPQIEVPNHGSSMQIRDSSRPVPDNNEI